MKTNFIMTETFISFKRKKASFNSFVVNGFSGCTIFCFRRYASKVFASVSVFLERFGPISVKYVLKCFAMTSLSLTILLFVMIFYGKNFLMFFAFPMEPLITYRHRFRLEDFFIPVVIQGLFKSFFEITVFFSGKK